MPEKKKTIYVELYDQDADDFDFISEFHARNVSNMVRWLIRQERARLNHAPAPTPAAEYDGAGTA